MIVLVFPSVYVNESTPFTRLSLVAGHPKLDLFTKQQEKTQ